MSKEFDEYIADKPELNLISKEEISLLKIKLGKSHRKESDWEAIKDIFRRRDVITFNPVTKKRGVKNIEKIFYRKGCLVVFSNIDDCTQYIYDMRNKGVLDRYVQIISIPFVEAVEISDRHKIDILIDVHEERNSRCFMYANQGKELKVVIMEE